MKNSQLFYSFVNPLTPYILILCCYYAFKLNSCHFLIAINITSVVKVYLAFTLEIQTFFKNWKWNLSKLNLLLFCFIEYYYYMHLIYIRWIYRSSQRRWSLKKVFLEISQSSQENSCARNSFLKIEFFQNF